MKKIKLTEAQLTDIISQVIFEQSYSGGIIQEGDIPCDIWCKIKVAKRGSRGDVVKMIQHLLARGCGEMGPYNPTKQGGGMNEGCIENWTNCDGKFEKETKKAVEEFQRDAGQLSVDGKVGWNTLNSLCGYCYGSASPKDSAAYILCQRECNCKQQQGTDDGGDSIEIDGDDWFIDIDIPAESGNDCDRIKACLKYVIGLGDVNRWEMFVDCMRIKDTPGTHSPDWFKDGCMKWVPYDWEKGGLVICISDQGNSYGPYYDEGGGVLVFPDGDATYYENLEISETRAKQLGIKGGGDIAVAASECCGNRKWRT